MLRGGQGFVAFRRRDRSASVGLRLVVGHLFPRVIRRHFERPRDQPRSSSLDFHVHSLVSRNGVRLLLRFLYSIAQRSFTTRRALVFEKSKRPRLQSDSGINSSTVFFLFIFIQQLMPHTFQEMIHMPILRHLHSLIASALIFGTAVLLMLWVPAKALRYLFPGFLPYVIASHAETPVSELSLELLLLQVNSSFLFISTSILFLF